MNHIMLKLSFALRRRNAATLRKPFQKPSNQDALHLLLQHTADLRSYQAAKSFKAAKVCNVETDKSFEAEFVRLNGVVMFPV